MSGLTVNDKPCWVLDYPGGPNEFEPHFDTEEKALKRAADDDEDNQSTPRRLDEPCVLAMTVCGYTYDEEEFAEHWPSVEELKQHLLGLDYRFTEDGSLLCPAENACDECDGIAAGMPPRPVELPGQMTFREVA